MERDGKRLGFRQTPHVVGGRFIGTALFGNIRGSHHEGNPRVAQDLLAAWRLGSKNQHVELTWTFAPSRVRVRDRERPEQPSPQAAESSWAGRPGASGSAPRAPSGTWACQP